MLFSFSSVSVRSEGDVEDDSLIFKPDLSHQIFGERFVFFYDFKVVMLCVMGIMLCVM